MAERVGFRISTSNMLKLQNFQLRFSAPCGTVVRTAPAADLSLVICCKAIALSTHPGNQEAALILDVNPAMGFDPWYFAGILAKEVV